MISMAEEEYSATEILNKKIGKSVLDHFTYLTSENEAKRIKSGSSLLQYLHKSSNIKDIPEIKYALKRIVRGLGGVRNSSRIGFYSTLVGLLHTFPQLTLEEILECINNSLQTEGGSSKSEAANIYTGQILACGALVRSSKIFSGTKQVQEHILRLLINAGKSRSYLSLASLKFLSELIIRCDQNQFKEFWSILSPEVLKPWSHQTHDSLYLLFLVQKHFPDVLKGGGALQRTIGTQKILSEMNLEAICNIVLVTPSSTTLKHFLYPLLSETLATSGIDLAFITELDKQLNKSNRNKLMASSLIIRHLLVNSQDSTKIPTLISNNFIKQILLYYRNNRINKNDIEFQGEITNFFDSLSKSLQKDNVDSKTKIKVLKKLIFYPGSFMFENITKSKNVQKLVRVLDKESVKKLSGLYKDVLIMKKEKVVDGKTEVWLNSERIYAVQLLIKLLSFPIMQSELEWKVKNLKLLIDVAILKNKYTNIGIELANNLREALFRALDLRFSKLDDVAYVLKELTGYLRSELAVEKNEILRIALTDDEFSLLDKLYSTTFKKTNDECSLVFQVLFLHMGLQLFGDKELAVSSLNELFMCYERVTKKQKQQDENDPEWIEVVVDLFLNLLSHNSLLLRNLVGTVFPYLCKYMTASSIHQILSVLDPKSDSSPLTQGEESDSESENSDESELDEEDNETVNDRLKMAVRDALGNNGYQTDEESVDLDDMTEDDAERLDKALAQAFKQFKPNHGKSKKQSKQEETLTHFRIRVMDLLEIYLDSEPVMVSCLEMMLPLLQVLEFTIKDEYQKPLSMRVKHCIKKLSNVKKFSSIDDISDTIIGNFLKSLLEKDTKNSMLIQDMSNEISDCCIFIIKCSQNDGLSPKIKRKCERVLTTILENAINTFFKQRDCFTPYGLFKSLFHLNWDGCLKLVPILFTFIFSNEVRPFRKNQALELLKIFYQNHRLHQQITIGEDEKQFCIKVMNMLDEFCLNPEGKPIKEKFISNLFNLLKAIYSNPNKNVDVDWNLVGEKIREFRSHVPLSKNAKLMYNQLCKELHIPHLVKMSNEVVKFSNNRESDDESSKKQKSSNESKKLRREAKTRRIENMSEGLGSFSFTNLDEEGSFENEDDSKSPKEFHNGPQMNSDEIICTKEMKRRKNIDNLEHKVSKKRKYSLSKS